MPARGEPTLSRRAFLAAAPAVLVGRAASAAVRPLPSPAFTVQPLFEPRRGGFAHLVLAAEGFRESERSAFLRQAERFAGVVRAQEPFAGLCDRLKVSVAWAASPDSGIPRVMEYDPGAGRWVRRAA